MAHGNCMVCGGSLGHLVRDNALYCDIRCKAKAQRQRIRAANPLPPPQPLSEAFSDKHTTPEEGCWLWQAGFYKSGYGSFRSKYAHRVSYEIHIGPIPTGMDVHHKCHEPRCVNPAHLEPLPKEVHGALHYKEECIRGHPFPENLRRLASGATRCQRCHREDQRERSRRQREPAREATKAKVIAIRDRRANGVAVPDVAAEFGVSTSTVLRIERREVWARF